MKQPMRPPLDHRSGESGQATLIALLVAVVLIGFLALLFFFRPNPLTTTDDAESAPPPPVRGQAPGEVRTPQTLPGQALGQAHVVECRNNLDQIRKAIQMENLTGEEALPPTLQAISGIPQSMKRCPVSGQNYRYDLAVGAVSCSTPGHQAL